MTSPLEKRRYIWIMPEIFKRQSQTVKARQAKSTSHHPPCSSSFINTVCERKSNRLSSCVLLVFYSTPQLPSKSYHHGHSEENNYKANPSVQVSLEDSKRNVWSFSCSARSQLSHDLCRKLHLFFSFLYPYHDQEAPSHVFKISPSLLRKPLNLYNRKEGNVSAKPLTAIETLKKPIFVMRIWRHLAFVITRSSPPFGSRHFWI